MLINSNDNFFFDIAVVSDGGSSLLRLFKQHVNLETLDQEEEPLVAEIDCESSDDEDDLNKNDKYPTFDQVDEEIQTTIKSINQLEINQVNNPVSNFINNQEIIPCAYEDMNETKKLTMN